MSNNILVFGAEHCGSRWISHNLGIHPSIDKVYHHSIPSNGTNPSYEIRDKLINTNSITHAVFIVRDASCIKKAQEKRPGAEGRGGTWEKMLTNFKGRIPASVHYNLKYILNPSNMNTARYLVADKCMIKNFLFYVDFLIHALEKQGIPFTIVSYEAMNQLRVPLLKNIFKDMKIDPGLYGYYNKSHDNSQKVLPQYPRRHSTDPVDGNSKYIKE